MNRYAKLLAFRRVAHEAVGQHESTDEKERVNIHVVSSYQDASLELNPLEQICMTSKSGLRV